MTPFKSVEELSECLTDFNVTGEDAWQYEQSPWDFDEGTFCLIDQAFVTGGVEGGSCWESSNPQPYSTDNEFLLDRGRFYQFIMEHFPDISFGKFSRIKQAALSKQTQTYREYYGNETSYEIWLIDVNVLFEMLNDA